MFDYTAGFGGGDWQITIGGGGGGGVYNPYPGTTYPPVTNYPIGYPQVPINTNQNQQILIIGLIVLAAVLLMKR